MSDSVYGPSWYAASMLAAPERDRLVYDLDVDACVIGGGLAGLTTARELARRGWSVAVLEAKRVAWDASGRNAGVVAPGFSERIDRIIERVGLDHTRALWILSAGGVDYVRSTIRETQMAGVSPVDGWLTVQRTDTPDRLFAQGELIAHSLGAEVEAWSTEQVRAALKTQTYFQGLHFPGAFHIHSLNYAIGLAAAAQEAGVKIFENTPALEVDAAGVRKRIVTPSGRVRAAHVVVAGSAHLNGLLPTISRSVMPVASYMAVTAPLSDALGDAIAYAGAISDTRRSGDYYRIVDGNRLMWGGRLSGRLSAPRRLGNIIRGDMLKIYPQLGAVEMSHAWAGTMGYAAHKMPQIGEVSRGLWVASAFGGHGINTSAMAGELIARAIVEGDDRWRLFASYDLVDCGGAFGRALAPALFWYIRARETLDERLAFRREATRRRREARAARKAEEARIRAEAEAQRQAELEAQLEAEREAERQAAAEAEARAALEAQRQAELEAHLEAERQAAAEAEARAELEAQRQAELAAHAQRQAAEAHRRGELGTQSTDDVGEEPIAVIAPEPSEVSEEKVVAIVEPMRRIEREEFVSSRPPEPVATERPDARVPEIEAAPDVTPIPLAEARRAKQAKPGTSKAKGGRQRSGKPRAAPERRQPRQSDE